MIDLQLLRQPEFVNQLENAARVKRLEFDVRLLVATYEERRGLVGSFDSARARQKSLTAEFQRADGARRAALKGDMAEATAEMKALRVRLQDVESRLLGLSLRAPSIPDPAVPIGSTDADNVVIRHWGEPRKMGDQMSDHLVLAGRLGLLDLERAQKFAGSRSYALTGNGALLARAVISLATDILTARGFNPVAPPVLVREEAMVGTGYFPLGTDEAYRTDREDRFLVGTSEVSLVSLHRDEVLLASDLPIRYVGVSSCFRREAGSHGRDTHGLYRVHQFEKVEQVSIIAGQEDLSVAEQDFLVSNSEAILKALELPYRVALACTGELGQGQRLKYEVETWMPSRQNYCETHSCSSFGDFQARRSNIRYRTPEGAMAFAYTLNNTGVAVPRILIPLLEHHQLPDGSVRIPEALQPYLNGLQVLRNDTSPQDVVRRGIQYENGLRPAR